MLVLSRTKQQVFHHRRGRRTALHRVEEVLFQDHRSTPNAEARRPQVWRLLQKLSLQLRDKCIAQGVGRDTPAEVEAATKKNLKALSVFLDDKKYLMGAKPSSVKTNLSYHQKEPLKTSLKESFVEEKSPA